jgi:hypothetical protein
MSVRFDNVTRAGARECDRTHSDPAHSRGARPRSGTSNSTAHERNCRRAGFDRATTACCWKAAPPSTADSRRGLTYVQ